MNAQYGFDVTIKMVTIVEGGSPAECYAKARRHVDDLVIDVMDKVAPRHGITVTYHPAVARTSEVLGS